MIIKSVNRADVQEISWRGKTVKTGIFKKEMLGPGVIDSVGLIGDNVVDKRYHGDYDKGIYGYGYNHYAFWQSAFPELEFELGMFGENLTIEGLDESKVFIGDKWLLEME